MSDHLSWLASQLEEWVAQGLLSREQALAVRRCYPEPKAATPWGMLVFTGIGAVVIGLGIILLFAYNWDDMPKVAKLAVVFGALAAAHTAGIALFRGDGWRRALGDTSCLLGTMLFGAGIWLIAQIYHIDEHYPNAFMVWCLGALAMAWVMPSAMQGMLAAVLATIWVCCEAADFQHAFTWAPPLIMLALGVLAWRLRSRVLLFFTTGGLIVIAAAITGTLNGSTMLLLLTVAAGCIALGMLVTEFGLFAESAPVWGFVGWSVLLVCCYILSFSANIRHLLYWTATAQPLARTLYTWIPFALTLALWGMLAWARATRVRPRATRVRPRAPDEHALELVLVPLAVIACQYVTLSGARQFETMAAGMFNLVLLALALAWMARGCRNAMLHRTIMGSAILAALVAGRYFDLFESLAARGFAFVLVGGVLFAEGILFMRARRRMRTTEVAS